MNKLCKLCDLNRHSSVSDRFERHKYTQYIEINGRVHSKFNKIISKNVYKILLSIFHIVGFCPLFMLWDYVLWDFVRRDFVLWDYVLWDSVPDSVA